MEQLSPNIKIFSITFPASGKTHDIYSFSAFNHKGNPEKIHVDIFRNGHALSTHKFENELSKFLEAAKSVRFVVIQIDGSSLIETKCSITNIYGGEICFNCVPFRTSTGMHIRQ